MLITLQEGCDYLIRRKANAALGIVPAWRDHLLATWEDDRTTTIGGIPVDLTMDVLESHRKALRKLRDSYWLAVEADLDKPDSKRVLNVIGTIPENARLTTVTRTSLAALVRKVLKETVAAWTTPEAEEKFSLDEKNQPYHARERTLLRVIALAARDLAASNSTLLKADGTPNRESVANTWLAHLTTKEAEGKFGLNDDHISRMITAGLKELG